MSSLTENLINGIQSPLHRFTLTCEPFTIAAATMGVASAGMNIAGQFQAQGQHNATEEYRRIEQENVIEENRRRATHDYLTNVRLEQTQQQQEEEAVAQKGFDIEQQAKRSVATGMASAAERGVAGRTVDQIAADFDFMANEETGRLKYNQKLAEQQHFENVGIFGTEYKNRIAAVKPYVKTPAKQIDFFGPIFQAGVQTLNTGASVASAAGGFGKAFGGSGFGAAKSNPLAFPSSVGVDPKYL